MMWTVHSVKLIQNTHLQLKPVEVAEGIGEANREGTEAAWLAAAVLAGIGVAPVSKTIKNQTLSFIVLCNDDTE